MRRAAADAREPDRTSVLRLLLTLASFAVTLYAGVRLLKGDTRSIVLWFVGAAVVHDLVLLPLYTSVDRALQRLLRGSGKRAGAGERMGERTGTPRINFVRVPAFVSGVLFLLWFPLILDQVQRYEPYTTMSADVFWGRWLLITAALFGCSAGCFLVGEWRGWRRGGRRRKGSTTDK